jgi:hypothetical protein
MRAIGLLVAVVLLGGPLAGAAAGLECTVTRKVDGERVYTAAALAKGQFSVRIDESAAGATVSRCSSTPSTSSVACDKYTVDRIERDPNIGVRKFYVFGSQFDVQVFKDLSFVENNGRGGIAFGTCRAAPP